MQCQFAYVYLCDRNDQLLICATKMSQFFQLNDGRKMPAVGLGKEEFVFIILKIFSKLHYF